MELFEGKYLIATRKEAAQRNKAGLPLSPNRIIPNHTVLGTTGADGTFGDALAAEQTPQVATAIRYYNTANTLWPAAYGKNPITGQ